MIVSQCVVQDLKIFPTVQHTYAMSPNVPLSFLVEFFSEKSKRTKLSTPVVSNTGLSFWINFVGETWY